MQLVLVLLIRSIPDNSLLKLGSVCVFKVQDFDEFIFFCPYFIDSMFSIFDFVLISIYSLYTHMYNIIVIDSKFSFV